MTEEPINYEEEWDASMIPTNMTQKRLREIRERYCMPHNIEMLVPDADERACYSRPGCVAVSEYLFKMGTRLPLHPFFRAVLRNFMLSSTQVLPNRWSQLVGSYFLWKEVSMGEDMLLHVFQLRVLGKDESKGWCYITSWGSHAPFVVGLPSSIKG